MQEMKFGLASFYWASLKFPKTEDHIIAKQRYTFPDSMIKYRTNDF